MNDPDRDAVYLCEDRVAEMARARAPITAGDIVLRPEVDHRFTTLAEVRLFCTLTCLEMGLPPVEVRRRAGEAKSHYSPARDGRQAEIALASWGASRLVVLHELAHHLVCSDNNNELSHGPAFRSALLTLLEQVNLPGQAQALRHAYRSMGLEESQ